MNLFTAAEKILLAKSNLDYRNANREELIENFTIKNLDTLQETENQNINTKSIILAPFNSSIKANDSFMHRDVIIENEVLKLCGKVKELNRNYELNNNGEIDNGIIISPQGIFKIFYFQMKISLKIIQIHQYILRFHLLRLLIHLTTIY